MFKINWKYFLINLLPPILRQPRQLAWLQVITTILRSVYEDFQKLKDKWFFDIHYTGQVCYLESRLRKIDASVFITDGKLVETIAICNKDEAFLPVFFSNIVENISPVLLINIYELTQTADFYVFVSSLSKKAELQSIVNQFKLYEKNYKIIKYEQTFDYDTWSDANIS